MLTKKASKALILIGLTTILSYNTEAQHDIANNNQVENEYPDHFPIEKELAEEGDAKYDPVPVIMEHVIDDHSWHLWTFLDEHGHESHVSMPLPVILIDGGLKVFMSNKFEHDHENPHLYKAEIDGEHYLMYNQAIYKTDADYNLVDKDGNILKVNHKGELVENEGGETPAIANIAPLDLSITKNVFALLISVLIIIFIFSKVASFYKRNGAAAPKGIASFLEPIILMVRDIATDSIGKKHMKFLPFLLTVFFFIWFNNLLGMIPWIPGGANLTGAISVTFTLATFTLILILANGNKHYWEHIVWMPGAPVPVKLLLFPIELVGVIAKPFALMIRLFANITAGHIVVLSLVSLVFIFKSVAMGAVSVPFALFISVLELLVAFLQAYVFTMLSALFIGAAVAEPEHH